MRPVTVSRFGSVIVFSMEGEKKTEVTPTGKVIEIVEDGKGRKSVVVNVNALNLENPTPDDLKAKEIIENQVMKKLNDKAVLCIVIHKPSNMKAHGIIPYPQVRNFAQNCIAGFPQDKGGKKKTKDFIIVVVDGNTVDTHSL